MWMSYGTCVNESGYICERVERDESMCNMEESCHTCDQCVTWKSHVTHVNSVCVPPALALTYSWTNLFSVCCHVECVAVCYSVLQCVAVCCSMLQIAPTYDWTPLFCICISRGVRCSVLQCAAVVLR